MTKVLIIEDEPQTRENLALTLQMEGYEAVTAANGRIGLETAAREKPDVILCDVSMPELDGHGVLRSLRAAPETANIPFIFLTARGEKQDQRCGMNLGADDYMVKPVEPDDLLAAIQARLLRQRMTADAALRGAEADLDFSSPKPLEGLGLTPREAEVLLWVAQGKSNSDVATILGMSDKTVKIHLGHVYEKLGVESRTAAAMHALEVLARARPSRSES
jgi:DNA-binding NarL/FixJ family response regulator